MGKLIWECNLHSNDVESVMPRKGFWYNVLNSWSKHNYKPRAEKNEMMNTIIWYNSEIKVNGRPIFIKKNALIKM